MEEKSMLVGRSVVRLRETDSTNAFLQRLLAQGYHEEGLVVSTGFQMAGRGQKGAVWHSAPDANILMSVLLLPVFLQPDRQFLLSQAVALAVRAVVQAYLPDAEVLIKWPNDIYANGQKIAGILIENSIQGSALRSSIVGIGLNVNDAPETATSMCRLYGKDLRIEEVEQMLFQKLGYFYSLLRQGEAELLQQDYTRYLFGYGQPFSYYDHLRQRTFQGVIGGITPEGLLQVYDGPELFTFNLKELSLI